MTHVHHYRLNPPEPGVPTVRGRCRGCGAEKDYPARLEYPFIPPFTARQDPLDRYFEVAEQGRARWRAG